MIAILGDTSHTHTHARTHAHAHAHTHTYTNTHTHMHVPTHACIHTSFYAVLVEYACTS